jgi:hypothetical protein
MNAKFLLSLLLSLSTTLAFTQSSFFRGGYGHFGIGPGWFSPDDFTGYLRRPEVMGQSLEWKNTGISAGGEGFAELRGLLIGGGGFGTVLPAMRSDSATAWVGVGGGYVKTGYVFRQTGRQFAAITAGFGAGGIGTNIKNNSRVRSISFDTEDPIGPRDEKAYAIAYALFDLGLSYKIVASSDAGEQRGRYSGFMFGIDLGTWLGIRMDEWRHDGEATSRIDSPDNFTSPYIRITIGGGGFRKAVVSE